MRDELIAILLAALLTAGILMALVCVFADQIFAEGIPVRLFHYSGQNALSEAEALTAFNKCRHAWNETFPHHSLRLEKIFAGEFQGGAPELSRFESYYIGAIWAAWAKMQAGAVHVSYLPALVGPDGVWYFAGLAGFKSFGERECMASVFAAPKSISGRDGVTRAAFISCHELAHIFGAEHQPGIDLMAAAPAAFVDTLGIQFGLATRREMRRFFRRIDRW